MSIPPVPPRFVPTLTEIVQPTPAPSSLAPALAPDEAVVPRAFSDKEQDLMVQRVLQRVELVLERRLREAVGQLILEHTQTLAPRLREEIELVVRQSVSQAIEQEVTQFPARS